MQTTKAKNRGTMITLKALLTAGLILAMMIPTLLVNNLVDERKSRQEEVEKQITQTWYKKQRYIPPYLLIPTTKTYNNGKNTMNNKAYKVVLPEQLSITGDVRSGTRKRSIYKVATYNAQLTSSGYFNLAQVKADNNEQIHWDKARICMGMSDMRGIDNDTPVIQVRGTNYAIEDPAPENALLRSGASAVINLSNLTAEEKLDFKLSLDAKGSTDLELVPLGKVTKVNIRSDWKNPSFFGNYLPQSTIDNSGFTASWKIGGAGKNLPQVWNNTSYSLDDVSFGIQLYQAADHYAKVERSIKYAILLIGLSFGLFFIMELLLGNRVHPVQYVLIGIALVVFYTLLLSLGEYVGFNIAYLLATSAVTILITIYCSHLFRRWKHALMVGIFLVILYCFVFAIVQLEELNLLAGSIGLFILVAAAMYISRKINWYEEAGSTTEPQKETTI